MDFGWYAIRHRRSAKEHFRGEERHSRGVPRAIVRARAEKPIETTAALDRGIAIASPVGSGRTAFLDRTLWPLFRIIDGTIAGSRRIFPHLPLIGGGVTAVGQETIGLQQTRRADELVGIPPERRAGGRAAGAEDALIKPVQLGALLRRLQALNGRCWRVVLQVGLNLPVLLKELGHVDDQITDHRQARQRAQYQFVVLDSLGQGRNAGQAVATADVQAVRATNTLAAGAPERQRWILGFQQFKHIQDHEVFAFGIHLIAFHERRFIGFGIVAIHFNGQHNSTLYLHGLIGAELWLKGIHGLGREVNVALTHSLV